ncbi:MAG TPA: hypothetical protein VFN09_00380 [Rhodanobacteraceae bacterium]|nr:hypothetical protein [Rhodanobacteraceae bacterium]
MNSTDVVMPAPSSGTEPLRGVPARLPYAAPSLQRTALAVAIAGVGSANALDDDFVTTVRPN